MDFMKLFALCRTSTLYFPSAHQLRQQDPFEGSYTLYHTRYQRGGTVGGPPPHENWITERHTPHPDWDARQWRYLQERDLIMRQNLGRYMFVNSWHMNNNESLAMWKLYDSSGYGIAVVSSFDRLKDSLKTNDETIFIGCVTYIDYNSEQKWLGNLLDPFMHKHNAFIHEKEVRAVVWHNTWNAYWERMNEEVARKHAYKSKKVVFRPRGGEHRSGDAGKADQSADDAEVTSLNAEPPTGIKLKCDLDRLIEGVVVSPTCQQWMVDLIREYCRDTIGKEVLDSELKTGPFF